MAVARLTSRTPQLMKVRAQVDSHISSAAYKAFRSGWVELYPMLRRLNEKRLAAQSEKKFEFLLPENFWARYSEQLDAILRQAIITGARKLTEFEWRFWSERGQALEINHNAIVEQYHDQIGRQEGREIRGISDTTRKNVGHKVVEWFQAGDKPFQDLVESLEPWFSRDRAVNIGRDQGTWLNSAVTNNVMERLDIGEWWWQTMQDEIVCTKKVPGPDGQGYAGCRELHGKTFKRGQAMPPLGSHTGCRCNPMPKAER